MPRRGFGAPHPRRQTAGCGPSPAVRGARRRTVVQARAGRRAMLPADRRCSESTKRTSGVQMAHSAWIQLLSTVSLTALPSPLHRMHR